jgi:hypothetical protein
MGKLLDLQDKLEVIRELMIKFGYSASLGDVEQALYNDLCHLIDEGN